MTTFTDKQQKAHREAFIEECRQKTWGAACHADWISKELDRVLAEYQKMQEEDRTLEADIKEAESAIDYHTVENRDKRKAKQERRNALAPQMKLVAENAQRGTQAMQQLLQSVESALQLAKHAEEWEWKEVEAKPKETQPRRAVYILQKDWGGRKAGEVLKAEEIGDGAIYKDLIAQGVIREGSDDDEVR
jgi:hypothetical protein